MTVYEELIGEMRSAVLETVQDNERKADRLRNGLFMSEERFNSFVENDIWDLRLALDALSVLDVNFTEHLSSSE